MDSIPVYSGSGFIRFHCIMKPVNTKNQVILILKHSLNKCRCLGDKPSINGGLKYLKYCLKIEKTTINFLSSTQKEYICKKWLPFETVLGD